MAATKHTLVALVADQPGVLNRIASLFRRRGFNMESVTVGHSEMPNYSRLTIVVDGTTTSVEQVRKQLDKIVDVVKVSDITSESIVARELALIKVNSVSASRGDIIEIADLFRASIVDVALDSLTICVTGEEDKIDTLIRLLRGFTIKEIARTGRVAMARGEIGPLAVGNKSSRPGRPKSGNPGKI
ncbi:MAG: acetolactate synthase small subunit [Dehalococcoidales bacterium]|jgi:acetolactate synthase-1/3 small subunit